MHLGNVIFSDIDHPSRSLVFHEQRTPIDLEVRPQFTNRGLKNIRHIQGAPNGLRDSINQSSALNLLGQSLFRVPAFANVPGNALNADRPIVAVNQPRTDLEREAPSTLRKYLH